MIILIFVGLLAVPAAAEEAAPTAVRVNATYDETTPDYGVLNFSSIQKAVDTVAAGGIVAVDAGTYTENLTVHQTVFLGTDRGAVIDAMGRGIGILIEADGVFIASFTVTNATTYGIAGDRVNNLTIRNTTVTVVSDETTPEIPAGIYLKEGTGHLVADNNVTVTSDLPKAAGIIASYVESSEVSNNTVSVDAARNADAPSDITALHDPAAAPWDQAAGHETVPALSTDAVYCEPYGIVATGTGLIVDGNSIGVAATCLGGSDEQIFCQAFPRGIQSDGESIEITENIIEITSNATDDALGEGIMAMGELSLIEGNCIILEATGLAANPWGIGLYSVPKGRVIGNEIIILVRANTVGQVHATTCGIGVHYSEKAQVLENIVDYTAYIGGGDAGSLEAGIEGIFVDTCYQSEVAGNEVCVDITLLAGMNPLILGSEDSRLASTAAAVHADLTGQSVEGWTGAIALHVDGSNEAWVTDNEIETKAQFLSLNVARNVSEVNGGVMAAGLLIRNAADAVASGNTIEAEFRTGGGSVAIGGNSSVACTNLVSQVFGVLLSDAEDAEVSDNAIAIESTQASLAVSQAVSAESGGLMGVLDDETAEDETEMNAFAASLDEEGTYAEELWDSLNETALARTRTTALSAGIYAGTDADTGIFDNIVDVGIASSVTDIAVHEVVAEDALTDVRDTAAGFGIIGPSGSEAWISGNNVTVAAASSIGAGSAEGEITPAVAADVRSQSQMRTTAHGIIGLAPGNEISDNVVTVAALGEGETVAARKGGQDGMDIARSRLTTRAVGITIRDVDQDSVNEVSGNTVEILSLLAPTAVAEGTAGRVGALIEGRAAGVGIRAPRAEISGNTVDVLSRVENATAVAEELSALEVRSETYALAIARGIVTRKATVTDNAVAAEGIASGTVVAVTEELLENARGDIFVGGIGLGIHDRALSTMTQNNVSGSALASGFGYIEGYRPEGLGIGFS
ncbi:right-handed parallel beta-helix repeat-containing protein, partial [Methanoculleus frigidifontis]